MVRLAVLAVCLLNVTNFAMGKRVITKRDMGEGNLDHDSEQYQFDSKRNVSFLGFNDVCPALKASEADAQKVLKGKSLKERFKYKTNKLLKASEKFRTNPVVDLPKIVEVKKRVEKFDSCLKSHSEMLDSSWTPAQITELKEEMKAFPQVMKQVYDNIMKKIRSDNLLKLLFNFESKKFPQCMFDPTKIFDMHEHDPSKELLIKNAFGQDCNVTDFLERKKRGPAGKMMKKFYDAAEGNLQTILQMKEANNKEVEEAEKVLKAANLDSEADGGAVQDILDEEFNKLSSSYETPESSTSLLNMYMEEDELPTSLLNKDTVSSVIVLTTAAIITIVVVGTLMVVLIVVLAAT